MTDQETLDKIAAWHFDGAGSGLDLKDYLGWTQEQYDYWFDTGLLPNGPLTPPEGTTNNGSVI